MKKIVTVLALSFLATASFGQTNSCCMQVITSKTNKPFDCLTTKKDSLTLHGIKLSDFLPYGTISYTLQNGEHKSYSFGSGVYGLNGQMVRFFSGYSRQGDDALGFISCPLIILNDACQLVCSSCFGDAGPPIMQQAPCEIDKAILISPTK